MPLRFRCHGSDHTATMKSMHMMHSANKARWDAASALWARGADSRGLWQRCPNEPELVLSATELQYLRGPAARRICVLGSGDNQVVFALAGMGADVTSVDVSENQLRVAEGRAREMGLSIRFVRADVIDLSVFAAASFDIVYTGGHVAVWVADLQVYYAEAARVLAPRGLFIVSEYHPFRRIWKQSPDSLVVEARYLDRGPFEDDHSEDVLARQPGELKSYEFHWTVADYLNAVTRAGCRIELVEEFGEQVAAWEGAPLGGLPEFLLIVARKDAQRSATANVRWSPA